MSRSHSYRVAVSGLDLCLSDLQCLQMLTQVHLPLQNVLQPRKTFLKSICAIKSISLVFYFVSYTNSELLMLPT